MMIQGSVPGMLVCALIAVLSGDGMAQALAFPGADGFGRFASGGRGGRVIAVTNLHDSGPGSLRDALEQKGARMIVFKVSGTITLKSDLVIEHGDLTIAGQTAPGDGICIRDYKTQINANNVIIRFLRFRLGDETHHAEDALGANSCRNVIIDHCSMSWGIDEVASFYDNEDFTLQWSIVSESLYNSHHSKGVHGYGGIWGGARASFLYNMLAHHSSRNPRFNGDRTSTVKGKELVDFRHNVVYNWGFKPAYGGEGGRHNVVANYFKPGPATLQKNEFLEPWDAKGKWFVAENILVGSPKITSDNRAGVGGRHAGKGLVTDPFPAVVSVAHPAEAIFEPVMDFGGAILPKRDAVDARIVNEVRSGTAAYGGSSYAKDHRGRLGNSPSGIIDSQSEVGGWPELTNSEPPHDTDGDGIPDAWEVVNDLNPHDPADGALITISGYSNLELYLNELAAGPWLKLSSHTTEK
jgi:hypothetical protein